MSSGPSLNSDRWPAFLAEAVGRLERRFSHASLSGRYRSEDA